MDTQLSGKSQLPPAAGHRSVYGSFSHYPPFSGRQQPAGARPHPVAAAEAGYGYLQFVSLEAAIEDNKEEYYRCLRQVQNSLAGAEPQYGEWLLFFLRTVQRLQNGWTNKRNLRPAAMTNCRNFPRRYWNWRKQKAGLRSNQQPKIPAPTSIRSKSILQPSPAKVTSSAGVLPAALGTSEQNKPAVSKNIPAYGDVFYYFPYKAPEDIWAECSNVATTSRL